jgi:hypothetical protein
VEVRYRQQLFEQLARRGCHPGGGYSSPAVANGVVYVGSYSGNVSALNAKPHGNASALNAKTGALLWKYATGNSFLNNSPAVAATPAAGIPRPPWRMGWFMSAPTAATYPR